MRRRAAGLALALAAGGVLPAAAVPLPEGAVRALEQTESAGAYALPLGPWAAGRLPVLAMEGAVRREVWQVPVPGISTVTLIAPLRAALVAEGWEVVLDCADAGCGGFDFRLATEVLPAPEMFVNIGDFRFLSVRREAQGIGILASRSETTGYLQIIVAGPSAEGLSVVTGTEAEAPAPVAPDEGPAEGIGPGLDRVGRAVLPGLSFAPGSAQLAPGDYPSLQELADWARANPDLRLALVGHTDGDGPLEGNIALSRRRAASVLERLVEDFGLPRSQLEAQGMGWLAPLASNRSAEGREANRRVEAIVLGGG